VKIVVQKFGGTSMGTVENRQKVAEKIIAAKKSGFHPVVVVSAIGRNGDPYATDTLIQFAEKAYKDTHPRELDLLMSCGEIISCVVMVNTLRSNGYDAYALTGGQAGIITSGPYGNSFVLRVEPHNIIKVLNEGKIPVVAGFQGMREDGNITTLGRGGSDTTAAILASALSAQFIEVYTDVDGIMTADPRIVPSAKFLKTISYLEVFQIADQGGKVIHPRAVEIAMESNIPLIIKNTMNDSPGTLITSYHHLQKPRGEKKDMKIVTGIAHITNRSQITIDGMGAELEDRILIDLAENNISIDLINIFPDKMIFTIDGKDTGKAEEILKDCKYKYGIIHNCSKISVIGNGMRGVPGVMSRIIRALSKNGINVLQTSDSHTTISCLVHGDDTVGAVVALHEEFELWRN
jgi:aspartate kinase